MTERKLRHSSEYENNVAATEVTMPQAVESHNYIVRTGSEEELPSRRMTASEVRTEWRDLVEGVAAKDYRVIVEKYGRPVAAVISAEEFEEIINERGHELARLREVNEGLQQRLTNLTARLAETITELVPAELARIERAVERIRLELQASEYVDA